MGALKPGPAILRWRRGPWRGYLQHKGKAGHMKWDEVVDCEGLLCPLPVLKARKQLKSLAPGAVLCVRATDPMAALDLPHFCSESGHIFLQTLAEGEVSLYLIRRKD